VSRSACSSQALTCWRACSVAGIPFGNSERRSASRFTTRRCPSAVVRRGRRGCADVGRPAARLRAAAAVLARAGPRLTLAVLARARAADEDAPVIPCALRRCAPSAAPRANDLPHSGQMNSPDPCLLALRVRGLGLLARRVCERGLFALRVRGLGLLALRVRGLGLLALRVRGLTSPVLLARQLRSCACQHMRKAVCARI
jgi:hypothetical protein